MASVNLYRKQQINHYIEAQRPTLGKRELESVLDCLIADRLSQGQITRRFERLFCSTFGFKHALALNSTTAAYHLAFLALELGANDHIILSGLGSVAACDAARYVSAKTHLVDVEQSSFHPSQDAIMKLIRELKEQVKQEATEKPKIVFVWEHSFGSPMDFDLGALDDETGVVVIEDFTGMLACERDDGFFGTQGTFGICAFGEYDLLTTGNGAMLTTFGPRLYQLVHGMRYGAENKRKVHSLAYDYRLGDFQTAIGIEQLSLLGNHLARRKKIGQRYLESLSRTPHESYFKKPGTDSYLRFPVIINKEAAQVERYFRSLQIGISRITETPLHHLLGRAPMEFPNAERLFRRSLCIPLYPSLGSNSIERVSSALRGIV